MKKTYKEYTLELEGRARFYMGRIGGEVPKPSKEKYYLTALAICHIIGDFTGEDRWDVYDRLKQEVLLLKRAVANRVPA